MKFVSYNIQYGLGRDGKFDIGRAAETVRGADVIALQEVERFWKRSGMVDQVEEIAGRLDDYYWVYGVTVDLDCSFSDGNGATDWAGCGVSSSPSSTRTPTRSTRCTTN